MSGEQQSKRVRLRRGSDRAADNDPYLRHQLTEQLYDAVDAPAQLKALGALGLTDADLMGLTGMSRTSIYAWRNGASSPNHETSQRIDDTRYAAARILDENVELPTELLVGWLRVRSHELEGIRPIEALAEGRFAEVVEAGLKIT